MKKKIDDVSKYVLTLEKRIQNNEDKVKNLVTEIDEKI